jgi:hypothetical protein
VVSVADDTKAPAPLPRKNHDVGRAAIRDSYVLKAVAVEITGRDRPRVGAGGRIHRSREHA